MVRELIREKPEERPNFNDVMVAGVGKAILSFI
jgi:hypothetical protein